LRGLDLNQRPLGYEYNVAMTGNPLILREKRSTAGGSTFSVDAWFLSLFRHISGCCGSKMEQKRWPCPGTVTPVVRVANVSRRTTSPVLSEPLARRALVMGVSRAPGSPLTPLNVSCSPGNVLPNSTPLNDPRMLCPRMLRRDDELQPDRGRFTREEPWAWPYPERGLSYPSWE